MKRIFLLGGYDLEMVTIRELLDDSGEIYFDKCLRWDNALLSMYQDVLDKYKDEEVTVYGIELRAAAEDADRYPRYKLIDHHNELSHHPAALEQIAGILQKPLTRFQQLVAANDSGYIPGMESLGGTKEEIDDIRRKDRRAQGVTEEDERLAEQAVGHHKEQYGSLVVVQSPTSRFSAVCDRLYPYHSLLVYNKTEWMFYGKGTETIIGFFSKKLKGDTFFYGGGTDGFAGVASGAYSFEEIEKMKEEIIKITTII